MDEDESDFYGVYKGLLEKRLMQYSIGDVIKVTSINDVGKRSRFVVRVVEVDKFDWLDVSRKNIKVVEYGDFEGVLDVADGRIAEIFGRILFISKKSRLRKLSDKEALLYSL